MEITSKWIDKYKFRVDDGRHPYFELDVPPKFGGEDTAPTALEMAVMALATCLGTTYKMTVDHMHLTIEDLEVKAIANKTDDIHLSDIHLIVRVKSQEPLEKLEKALHLAEKNCAVDIIFQQTKIPMETKLEIIE
ncbi:MAG: OsmC family protein [Candidatus Heimdallarchaeota archaeon]|nr:OsmC family protein [Candidatus Heimdallarchaeota archaeon]MBY8994332.1 OsmC family protein [Candidatus Heimdallarchaeota archaeon]